VSAPNIPFNRATFLGTEEVYLRETLERGRTCGDGPHCRRAEQFLEDALRHEGCAPEILLTTSCTHALEMSAILLDVKPGDEVIVPSFTFVSTANAFALRGARPVFADIRPDTLNIDENRLEGLVTERTKAIIVVHYGGVGCEMDVIGDVAARHDLKVVEDNAHGLFGTWRGQPLGTLAALATQSFHETKNFSCGEGGALVINDPKVFERAEIIREKGTNRSRFFRGQVDKYTWVDLGSSYVLSDLLGAVLLTQLEAREKIQARRRQVWDRYASELASWAETRGIRLPVVPAHCEHTSHVFYLLLPTLERRTAFIAHLAARGVVAVFHYVPLNLSPVGSRFGAQPGDCPVTERISDQLVRLPLYFDLTENEQARVIDAVLTFD
jgi:dTDP-4-amino-4,6-dideoxygalactose transaminase